MSTKRKILLLTDWYEPGFKAGGPIQSCRNFVAAMHETLELSVVTSDRDQGDPGSYPGIVTNHWITRDPGIRIYYAGPGQLNTKRIRQLVSETGPDYLYLNSMYSYRFTILPLWLKFRGRIGAKIVLAPRGMLQEGAMRFKSWKKKLFIQLINLARLPRQLSFQATDEQEERDILRYFPSAGRVSVVPNFVRSAPAEWKPVQKTPGRWDGVFVSRIAPKKNLLFFLGVLKRLPPELSVTLHLYGEIEDAGYWEKCLSVIRGLPASIRVEWKGAIPNDIVPEVLQRHHFFVLPTLGENFGHAIFEALSVGKPVLISDKTPWREMQKKLAGYDLPLDEALFGETVETLAAMDQAEYDKWSLAAFEYAGRIRTSGDLKERYRILFS
jgi:glycosyltransferase involved in cell wall biosynthesis